MEEEPNNYNLRDYSVSEYRDYGVESLLTGGSPENDSENLEEKISGNVDHEIDHPEDRDYGVESLLTGGQSGIPGKFVGV